MAFRAGPHEQIISIHPYRRTARAEEREIQFALDVVNGRVPVEADTDEGKRIYIDGKRKVLADYHLPSWADGAKVERAGLLSFAVIATSNRGH